MTEVEKLKERLYGEGGLGVTSFNIFPGTNPNVTAEEVAREVNHSLDQLEAGNFEEIDLED